MKGTLSRLPFWWRRAAGLPFLAVAAVVEPVRLAYLWRPTLPDANDDMVLEAAVIGRADGIVTLNRRHFGLSEERFGIAVMSPGEAVGLLREKP